ncbi:DegT/DnrJ/EryC1/StrS aminotransferase family protein [Streptomyces sp. MUM 203J]|uniref:DegT/DnrJ/EryC1/StrS family aminotransferase n=1 Tax=Streptomyces sp. MUM 203J TaxID=2791990 RepID=UPI001F03E5A4|nr:DegT/DnrJ/EryC1/StrS family aminotransferase [Streptomyces sp. MUM 203J]MCH0538405.1 DegT/DnrJ/EryC1/StrS aminotransferase family protein [Streptomyces sp. MUM 203J]
MRRRLGRECLYVPSCRLGLYLALRRWCRPGGRVLMSPVNDDVIFFVVLAAGLRPVQAPLRARDASIDASAVPEGVWRGLSGVLTANLYGNPDPAPELAQRCGDFGIPLLEDCAHAIGSGTGTHGDASVFSLSKHAGVRTGGFLAVRDPAELPALARERDRLLQPARHRTELAYLARPYAEAAVRGLRLAGAARTALRLLGREERDGIRMPLRGGELKRALDDAPGLDAFHPWVRVDLHDYRLAPGRARLRRVEKALRRLDGTLDAHRAGAARLQASPWGDPQAPDRPLFRVPLLVADRDAAIAALARHRITTGYLYDPPLDDYAGPDFTDPAPRPDAARWFARHALPADPLRAGAVLRVLHASGARPAPPPPPGARGA